MRNPHSFTLAALAASACYSGASNPDASFGGGQDLGTTTDTTGDTTGDTPTSYWPAGTSVLVEVRDATGAPVPKAIVTVISDMAEEEPTPRSHPLVTKLGGTALAEHPWFMADGVGRALIERLVPGRVVLRVDADGYTASSAVLDLTAEAHVGTQVTLLKLGKRQVFDAQMGADLHEDRARLKIPANSVTDLAGQPVTGLIEATLTPLDPAKLTGPSPWPLIGRSEGAAANEPLALLESVYMVEISLWQDGRLLRLAEGASADLEILLPEGAIPDDTQIPHWWYDFDLGAWQEETFGTIAPSLEHPGQRVWRKTLTHFSPQNLDTVCRVGCVDLTLYDHDNLPVANTKVIVESLSPNKAYVEGFTDNKGHVCLDRCTDYDALAYAGEFQQPTSPQVLLAAAGEDDPNAFGHCGGAVCTTAEIQFLPGQEPLCTPGEYMPCDYDYPELDGHGQCSANTNFCTGDGHWTGCEGEVLPAEEVCNTDIDEDCDDNPHGNEEGCECSKDDDNVCYTGPAGTFGVGQCHEGVQTCSLDTLEFGDCENQVVPVENKQSDCATLDQDEDCDGNPACGDPVFGLAMGDASLQEARGIVAAPDGGSYVVGHYSGALTIEGKEWLPAPAGSHAFVLRLDPAGAPLAALDLGDFTDLSVYRAPDGDLLVGGTLSGDADACGLLDTTSPDLAIVALDADLFGCTTVRYSNAPGVQRLTAIAGQGDDIVLAGVADPAIPVDLGFDVQLPASAAPQGFVLKLEFDMQSESYVPVWITSLPREVAATDARTPTLAIGAAGIFVADVFAGQHEIGGVMLAPNGPTDFYLIRLDDDGAPIRAAGFGASSDEPAMLGLTTDSLGTPLLTGLILPDTDLGGAMPVTTDGTPHVFVARYLADLHLDWSTVFPGESSQVRVRGWLSMTPTASSWRQASGSPPISTSRTATRSSSIRPAVWMPW